jgi:hypothetical protein
MKVKNRKNALPISGVDPSQLDASHDEVQFWLLAKM